MDYRGELKKYVTNLISKNPPQRFKKILIADSKLDTVLKLTEFLKDDVILSERLYCIVNDITNPVLCECGKAVRFKQMSFGYFKFCSAKCSANSETKKAKIIETNIKKYGCENVFQIETSKRNRALFYSNPNRVKASEDKRKRSLVEKYNVQTFEEADELRRIDAQRGKLEKYGNPHFNNRPKANLTRDEKKMVHKLSETCLIRFGVPSAMQYEAIFNKKQEASFKKKEYIFPSGKEVKIQGYENLALDILLEDHNEDDIIVEKGLPEIWYYDSEGVKRRYYPDIFIKSTNTLIEVKSDFTMKSNFYINLLKAHYSKMNGFAFKFMIFNGKGILIN